MQVVKLISILLISITLSACARDQGALLPTGLVDINSNQASRYQDKKVQSNDSAQLPDVEAASLEPVINYIDGLNQALAGDLESIKEAVAPGCGCLAIIERLKTLFKNASLTGGNYQLKSIDLLSDSAQEKSFKVVVDRGDLIKIDKKLRQSVVWSASQITTKFIVKRVGSRWLLSDTQHF
ncbi:MAG: hypothetical protein RIS93_752 [Actinomycetota bacterium]